MQRVQLCSAYAHRTSIGITGEPRQKCAE